MDPLSTISTRRTPQREQADKRQVKNSAGGYTFTIEPVEQLRRFLTLGTDGPTYYASAQELSIENAAVVMKMAETDHLALVDTIMEVSLGGRAPKQNATLFALAIACSFGSDDERRRALSVVGNVCRTGTMLFQFVGYVEQFRGWGRGLRRAISDWYMNRPVDRVAFQAIKYRQRAGWTHRDLLRLAHPETADEARSELFQWITKGESQGSLPQIVHGFRAAQAEGADIPALIQAYGLPWEALPTEALKQASTWEALLDTDSLPHGALIRNLPRLTNLGLLPQMGGYTELVVSRLVDPDALKAARIHPVNVLVAQKTYASGQGFQGKSTWTPTAKVIDALDGAFYASFGNVEPAGKRTLIGLDVSGSMGYQNIANLPLTPREASAALSLVQMATEPMVETYGFTAGTYRGRRTEGLSALSISPRQRLDDVVRTVSGLPFGRTDCSLPMEYALEVKKEVDTFLIYTDNETWFGSVHPHQALRQYRERMGIDAKLVVVAMTPTRFSIADPSDRGMLDVAGFDSAVPTLISDFSRGA